MHAAPLGTSMRPLAFGTYIYMHMLIKKLGTISIFGTLCVIHSFLTRPPELHTYDTSLGCGLLDRS